MDITSQICPLCRKHFIQYRGVYDNARRPKRTKMDAGKWTVFNIVLDYVPLPCKFEKEPHKNSVLGSDNN